MNQHEATVVNLAREYNVSVNFLLRYGVGYFFDSPPTGWDNFRIDMLKKYEPEVVVFIPTQLYEGGPWFRKNEMQSLPATSDALLSGNPDKVLIMEDNPKYREVIDHQTVYPAFMDANGTFLQLIGVETEGGNKLLFGDRGHLSPDGSARLEEYFREHVFKDLNCTK